MRTYSIASVPTPAQAANRRTPPETTAARNRRLLTAFLTAGGTVRHLWGDHWAASSRSNPTAPHELHRWQDGSFEHISCTCSWQKRSGRFVLAYPGTPAQRAVGALPCGHVLAVRFALLPADARAALLASDAELAAAVAGAPPAGLAPRAPIDIRPYVRRERVREAF